MRSLTEGIDVKARPSAKGASSASKTRALVGLGIVVVLLGVAGWLYFGRGSGETQDESTRAAAERTEQMQAAMQSKTPPPAELPVENRSPRGAVK